MTTKTIGESALRDLRARFAGEVITPGDATYDEHRKVWNGMIDLRPGAIARATSVEDVVAAVNVARDAGALLAIRGGGHSMQGFSTCDGGIVLDLSLMNEVVVDAQAKTARVAGGAHVGHLDRATQAHGLATPSGTVSHTGVAGLTLGGGFGRLTPKYGLSIDNLLSVEVVTAEGKVLHASEDENPDLFWAMRGAGANFGVATSFEFRLHHIGTDIGAAINLYEIDDAPSVLRARRDLDTPPEMIGICALSTIPAGPPFPPQFHGKKMLIVAGNHVGAPDAAERDLGVLSTLGTPAFSAALRMPYLAAQQVNDEVYAWGKRYYIKGSLLRAVTDDLIDTAVDRFASVPGADTEIDFIGIGRVIARVPEDATAYSGRSAEWYVGINCAWHDPAEDDAYRAWSRDAYAAFSPAFLDTNYINAIEDSDPAGAEAAYGATKYARLQTVKRTYDPDNLFRLNANIAP